VALTSYRVSLYNKACCTNSFVLDEKQTRNLVLWLEDTKIRYYDSEQREPLRDIASQYWPAALKKVCTPRTTQLTS